MDNILSKEDHHYRKRANDTKVECPRRFLAMKAPREFQLRDSDDYSSNTKVFRPLFLAERFIIRYVFGLRQMSNTVSRQYRHFLRITRPNTNIPSDTITYKKEHRSTKVQRIGPMNEPIRRDFKLIG